MKRLTITGNIGRDPELRLDPSGNQFATFSVAVPVGTKTNPKTDWIDVSCNGKLAEVACTYTKKGTKVLVDGYPSVNAYINKDNIPVGTMRLYANSIEILSKVDNETTSSEIHPLPDEDANSLEVQF